MTYWVENGLYHRKQRKLKSPENAVFTGLLARCGGLEPSTYWFVAVSIAVKQALNSDV